MKSFRLPKKSGGWRVIYTPHRRLKTRLRLLVPEFDAAMDALIARSGTCAEDPALHGVVHGFRPGHSPVTQAWHHVGFAYTLSADLSDFFDTVTPAHLPINKTDVDDEKGFARCFVDGAARQGLPTSPALANLAALSLDRLILQRVAALAERGITVVYTRYADDLNLSSDDKPALLELRTALPDLATQARLVLHPHKTRLQWAGRDRSRRRVICGVAVGDCGVDAPRDTRRRLRSAVHHGHWRVAAGLREWCRLRLPNPDKQRNTPVTQTVVRHYTRLLLDQQDRW